MRFSISDFTSNLASSFFKTNPTDAESKIIFFSSDHDNLSQTKRDIESDDQINISKQEAISISSSQTLDDSMKSDSNLFDNLTEADDTTISSDSRPTKKVKICQGDIHEPGLIKSNKKVPRDREPKYGKTISFIKINRQDDPRITKRLNNYNGIQKKDTGMEIGFQLPPPFNMNFNQAFYPFPSNGYVPFVTPLSWPFEPTMFTNPRNANQLSSHYNLTYNPNPPAPPFTIQSNRKRTKRKRQLDNDEQKDVFSLSSEGVLQAVDKYLESADPFQWNYPIPDCLIQLQKYSNKQ